MASSRAGRGRGAADPQRRRGRSAHRCRDRHRRGDGRGVACRARWRPAWGRLVVVTGTAGAAAAHPDGARARVAASGAGRVIDTTGAGDAFSGAVIESLTAGVDLESALHEGVVLAAAVARVDGRAEPRRQRAERYPRRMTAPPPDWLAVSEEVATALAEHRPVVALESSLISQGLPAPHNLETARAAERGGPRGRGRPRDGRGGGRQRRGGSGCRAAGPPCRSGAAAVQGRVARSGSAARRAPPGRHHGQRHHARGAWRGDRTVRHRWDRRRAPRRGQQLGHQQRPRRAGGHPGRGGVQRREVDPRPAGHPRGARDASRAVDRLRDGSVAGVPEPGRRARRSAPRQRSRRRRPVWCGRTSRCPGPAAS